MTDTTATKRLTGIDRLKNSPMGAPNYRLTFDDGTSAVTSPDANDNYAISDVWLERVFTVTFTPAGKVRFMQAPTV